MRQRRRSTRGSDGPATLGERLFDREVLGDIAGPAPDPVIDPPASGARVAPPVRARAAAEDLGGAESRASRQPRRVGIVLVHGIGSQLADRTLIEWAGPLVRSISAWQEVNRPDLVGALVREVRPDRVPSVAGMDMAAEDSLPGNEPTDQALDPVVNASLDFTGDEFPLVRLSIPGLASKGGTAAAQPQTWLLTEAWWSSRVEPPSFATMVDWCGRQGIVARVAKAVISESGDRWSRATSALGLGLFLSTMTTLALFLFGFLKTIAKLVPIDAVKDATIFAAFETFLTTWWGDVYVLLRNPVEAANIRGRLGRAILYLRDQHVDALVVIGHSGGTVVAYTTLSDPGLAGGDGSISADLFISHGEAINLARTLTAKLRATPGAENGRLAAVGAVPTADRTSRDSIRTTSWVDFYASRDPAPNGPLAEASQTPGPGHPQVDSRPIWNRMSISEDHGGYWDNDEQFVGPVLRLLDVAGLPSGSVSRFETYGDNGAARAAWDQRHKERVWTLALWRRLMFVVPFAVSLLALLPDAGFARAVTDLVGTILTFLNVDKTAHAVADPVAAFVVAQGLQASLVSYAMVGLGLIVFAAFVHSLFPLGRWTEAWIDAPARRWATTVELLATIASGITFLAVIGRARLGVHGDPSAIQPDRYAIPGGIGLLVGVGLLAYFYWTSASLAEPATAPQRSIRAGVLTGALILFVVALLVTALTDQLTQRWLVGTAAVILIFRQIESFGTKRWVRWDENERDAARRWDPEPPSRGWPKVQAAAIAVGTILVAVGLAFADGASGFPASAVFGIGVLWFAVAAIAMTIIDGSRSETTNGGG